ncbi:MAG TPA: helix-turn-helix domain-containing protein [Candidatus Limnocylindria bacterium]|jgi:AcrR family transcriptional regulator
MIRIAKPEPRPYDSPLRAEQVEETRARILEAAIRVMAGGIASVSMPAIAREAAVSVPTVYRHFGTKGELLTAVYPYVARKSGLDRLPDPTSLDDLRDSLRRIFERTDALDELARAAMASPGGEEVRRATMPGRLARIGRWADGLPGDLADADRARIARLLAVLTTSGSLRMWRDHLGVSAEQAADDIDFIVRAAVAASTRTRP